MLSTAKIEEVPDERQILTSQLITIPTAADYVSSAPPCHFLSIKRQTDLKLFLRNWNLLTTNKWILQAV